MLSSTEKEYENGKMEVDLNVNPVPSCLTG